MIFVYNYVRRVELVGDTNMLYNPSVDPEEGRRMGVGQKIWQNSLFTYAIKQTNNYIHVSNITLSLIFTFLRILYPPQTILVHPVRLSVPRL